MKERIVLNKNFQRGIFEKLLEKFSARDLTEILGLNQSSLYFMKMGKISSIDLTRFQKVSELLNLSDEVIKKNTIKIISREEMLNGLELGRKMRTEQLRKWKSEIPRLRELISGNKLNVEEWFEKYIKLTDFGTRKVTKITKDENRIMLCFETHSNTTKTRKKYKITLPKQITIDDEFSYFLGLWCGDRAGGGRVGILNMQSELILFTAKYLRKMYQKPTYVLLKSTNFNESLPSFPFKIDKIQPVKNMSGTYTPMVFSVNGYLKSFFDFLDEDLDLLLSGFLNKKAFFAGLFDAEGNVVLEDKYFRWACKNPKKVEIYKKHLSGLGLFKRYDGGNLVTGNSDSFLKNVCPFIKHKKKINRVNLLFFNSGHLENYFKRILIGIRDSPGLTIQELNKIFGKKKLWPQIKFLHECGYVQRSGYPMKIDITQKGLNEVKEVVM